MKSRFLIPMMLFATVLLAAGCHQRAAKGESRKLGSRQKEIVELYNMADSVYYKESRIDTAMFARFIEKAVTFAEAYPKDEISEEMLYRAGIGSMILAKAAQGRVQTAEHAKKALYIFNLYQKNYPDSENARYCYYQRGIIYDDILGDCLSAENEYRDFINRYPDDPLSTQLSEYIKMLGKSDKEIEKMMHINQID